MEVALDSGRYGAGLSRAACKATESPEPRANRFVMRRASDAPAERPHRGLPWLRDWELGRWGLLLVVTRPEGRHVESPRSASWSRATVGGKTARDPRLLRSHAAGRARGSSSPSSFKPSPTDCSPVNTRRPAPSSKLNLYNPYMTGEREARRVLFLLKYVIFRNTEYQFLRRAALRLHRARSPRCRSSFSSARRPRLCPLGGLDRRLAPLGGR